ncbi:unnamed protein product [Didymodactylos carnosus]|uniref:Uncharacterized protein n=1 Tax=Didymodactylos carnosus TaxID=1234261 RepID=A0A816A5S7_9BILA|nr:unnamed protein product [Didymodactylos carnosus]CAF1591869.1 unnamed protein product [Didymodactylos carnosus]CAF4233387.1 unnamed protein product [Didymodactylos carnosus]CAF4464490.1 unnamed protein product [Didymodactylos carnosus]
MSGCIDTRQRFENMVGKDAQTAASEIRSQGYTVEITMDGTKESDANLKPGIVKIIADPANNKVKYTPMQG